MEMIKQALTTKAPVSKRGLIAIPKEDVGCGLSPLTEFLDYVVNYDNELMKEVDKLIARFHLGTVRTEMNNQPGAVIPRINKDGKIVGGSVLYFDYHTGYVLKAEKLTDHLYPWYCYDYYEDDNVLFGEHTLSGKPIAVVREEKTALLGMLTGLHLDWLAVGYGRKLTQKMIDKLYGKQAILFPDDSIDQEWEILFGSYVKVDKSFVSQDINKYIIDKVRDRIGLK